MHQRVSPPAVVLLLVLLPGASLARPSLTSSERCGTCHRDIFKMWRASAHARSASDPVFLQANRDAAAREGTEVSRACLRCHAPAVEVNGDYALERDVTTDGTSCDLCHSIAEVSLAPSGPRYTYDVGETKRGPIRDAESSEHEILYSELHTQAEVCAGCHEYVNTAGTPIMTTFSEWQKSGAARDGKNCQECHMGKTKAQVVDPRVKRVAEAEVNLHQVPGGHSIEQLNKALGLSVTNSRDADALLVEVELNNKGAGHAVPTGMPGRRVILEVTARGSDGTSSSERRIYQRSFLDAAGTTVTRDSGYFAKGVLLEADTRIQADERRTESFRFPIPAAARVQLAVRLHYEHAPTGDDEDRTWLTFMSENRSIPPAAENAEKPR